MGLTSLILWELTALTGGIDAVRQSQLGLVFKTGMPTNFQEQLTKALADGLWNNAPAKAVSKDRADGDSVPDGVTREYLQQMIMMVRA